MSQPTAAYRLVLLAICVFVPALQADWITESELLESCKAFVAEPGNQEGSSCLAFVQGFLVGAEQLAITEDGSATKESFTERAMRTRLSTAQLRRIENDAIQPYCVDENTPVPELLEAIRDHLGGNAQDANLVDPATLRQALIQSFPCDA